MPELPEVETIKKELSPHVIGRRFTDVIVCDAKPVKQPSVEEFRRKLIGQSINDLERRGKYLIFRLSSGKALVIHLKMTGALLLNPKQPDGYARVIFHLDNNSQLVFTDRRRLGALWLLENEQAVIGKLGPEPLTPELTVETLAKRLHKRQAPIKAVLLDQAFIAGIGNMYADEALFAAKIHPLRKADSLSPGKSETCTKPLSMSCGQPLTAKVPALTLINAPMDSWAPHIITSVWLTAAASHALSAAHPSSALLSETAAAISAPTARSHKHAV